MADCLKLTPTTDPKVFQAPDGTLHTPPSDWACLPPGDAGWTRRVKAAGPTWQVAEKVGRKEFSRGLWAPAAIIAEQGALLEAERSTPSYARKRAGDEARRAKAQAAYVVDFESSVRRFLAFAPAWKEQEALLSRLVAEHATPVGSGTVARTERIPIEDRARSAVVAWMRHQTTGYDDMSIARVKGARREVRRNLARLSLALLDTHRTNLPHGASACPLCQALQAATP